MIKRLQKYTEKRNLIVNHKKSKFIVFKIERGKMNENFKKKCLLFSYPDIYLYYPIKVGAAQECGSGPN